MSGPLPRGAGALSPERLGVDPSARGRFSAEQQRRVEALLAELREDAAVAETKACDAYAAARLTGPAAVLIFLPAVPGAPSLFTEGGVAVRYDGERSAALARCLQAVHRHLRLLPRVSACDGVRKAPGTAPRKKGSRAAPRPKAPEPRMRAPMPLMAPAGGLDARPHDADRRALAELLWLPCPSLRFGSACNLKCTYCSVGSDGQALVDEEVLRAQMRGLRALGYRGIGYMGGEPTVHPSFLEVARHAAKSGFERQVLVTNGIKLGDPAFAEKVVAAGVRVVMVSIDAFDRGVQEKLYGLRGGYEEALAGLHNVLAAPGVEVALSAVVTKANAHLFVGYMDEVAALQKRYGKRIGVLLHALQLPAAKGGEQKAIALGLLEASAAVTAALGRAREAGVTAITLSFPPCLLPGHETAVSELYANEWLVDLEGGAAERSVMRGAAAYWLPCAACPDAGHCPGVLKQYADEPVRAAVAARRAPSKPKGVFLCSRELGCPVNLSWTTRLHNYVRANGWTFEDAGSADVIVIVSCSTLPVMREAVSAAAEYFSRRYPAKKVVVSGCFVRRDMIRFPNLSYVSMTDLAAFDALLEPEVPLAQVSSAATVEDNREVREMADARAVRNRPYNVMVSAGCLNHCTFCIGKSVFPTVRSLPLEDIVRECRDGLAKGYTNFTIGGSDVAAYGHDIGLDAADLFEALFDRAFKGRRDLVVGFKGLEPSQFLKRLPKLKKYFASGRIGWICLPIQSGSDRVLEHMRRDYRIEDVLAAVRELRALAPGLRVDTDLMFCYPTETAEDFEASLSMIPHFDHVQMLMFERHKNTSAYKLKDVFTPEEKARRARVLESVLQRESQSLRPECRPRVEISLPSPLGDAGFSVLMEHRGDRPAA